MGKGMSIAKKQKQQHQQQTKKQGTTDNVKSNEDNGVKQGTNAKGVVEESKVEVKDVKISEPSAEQAMPLQGILFSFLVEFAKVVDSTYTTRQVCDLYIMPLTAKDGASFADYLADLKKKGKKADKDVEGKENDTQNQLTSIINSTSLSQNDIVHPIANTFISHCWAFKFSDVIQSLVDTIPEQDWSNHYIWFDAFIVNQHKRTTVSQDWWSKVFRMNVQRIGRTYLILGDWSSPMALTRAWCLWEILSSIENKKIEENTNNSNTAKDTHFQISVSEEEEDKFLFTLLTNYDEILKMLSHIDAAKADAFLKQDRDMIFEAIRRSVGFHGVNQCVLDQLRKWLIDTSFKAIERFKKTDNIEEIFHKNKSDYKKRVLEIIKGKDIKGMIEPENEKSLMLAVRGLLNNQSARLCADQGEMDKAMALQTETIEIDKIIFPYPNSSQIGRDYNNLGYLSLEVSDYEKAEHYLKLALDVRKAVAENQEEEMKQGKKTEAEVTDCKTAVARTLFNVGNLADKRGNFVNAEEIYRQVIDMMTEAKDQVPKTHIARVMTTLAEVIAKQGNRNRATEVFEESLRLIENSVGKDHLSYVISQNSYARHLTDLGLLTKSLEIFDTVVDNAKRILGDTNPTTGEVLTSRARCLAAIGAYERAMEDQALSLEILTNVYGANHASVANAHNNVGYLAMQLSQLEKAKYHLSQALEIRSNVLKLGDKHLLIATTLCNLAQCEALIDSGKSLEGPLAMIDRAYTIIENINPKHPFLHQVLMQKSEVLHNAGRYKESIDAGYTAINLAKESVGPSHPRMITCYADIARYLSESEKLEESEALLQEGAALAEKLSGENIPLSALNNAFAVLRHAQGREEEALVYQRKALEEDKKVEKFEGLAVAKDYQNIGYLLSFISETKGKEERVKLLSEAVEYTEKAVQIRTKVLGPNALAVARTICNLAEIRVKAGEMEKARQGYSQALSIMQNRDIGARNREHESRVRMSMADLILISYRTYSKDPNDLAPLNEVLALVNDSIKDSSEILGAESIQVGTLLSLRGEIKMRILLGSKPQDQSDMEEALTDLNQGFSVVSRALHVTSENDPRNKDANVSIVSKKLVTSLFLIAWGEYIVASKNEDGSKDQKMQELQRIFNICSNTLGSMHPDVEVMNKVVERCKNI